MPRRYGKQGSRKALQRPCLSLHRDSQKNHLRQRHAVHVTVLQRALCPARNQTEYEFGLSPPNRWAVQTNKPNGGDNLMNLLQPPTRQLGRLAQSGPVYDQLPSLFNHQETPVRTMDGIHSPHPSTHACRERTSDRRKEVPTSRS